MQQQQQTKKLTQVESYNATKKMAQLCCAVFSMWPSLPHWNPELHFFYCCCINAAFAVYGGR
jgi:hypothetical protein